MRKPFFTGAFASCIKRGQFSQMVHPPRVRIEEVFSIAGRNWHPILTRDLQDRVGIHVFKAERKFFSSWRMRKAHASHHGGTNKAPAAQILKFALTQGRQKRLVVAIHD